jgi:hypothetical protein
MLQLFFCYFCDHCTKFSKKQLISYMLLKEGKICCAVLSEYVLKNC